MSVERRLNRQATTILIGGVFLTLSAMMYLTFCNMPCEDCTYRRANQDHRHGSEKGQWREHILAQSKDVVTNLVILVLTSPNSEDRRHAIRETWLKDKPPSVVVYFAIGSKDLSPELEHKIKRENILRKDLLLLEEHKDSYVELSRKLMLSLEWVHEHVDFKYLLKVDDDSFVRLTPLLQELHTKFKERLYWGFFNGRAHVKQTGKWKEKDWVLCDRYLPYALGGGYVISSDLVHHVAMNKDFFQTFLSEDVSLGTWLAPVKINRIHDPRFDTEYKSRGCSNSYLITHKKSIIEMRDLYKNLQETGHICRKEYKVRNSYIYNWNVPPTLCCNRNDSSVP